SGHVDSPYLHSFPTRRSSDLLPGGRLRHASVYDADLRAKPGQGVSILFPVYAGDHVVPFFHDPVQHLRQLRVPRVSLDRIVSELSDSVALLHVVQPVCKRVSGSEKNRSLAASEDSSDEPDLCRGAGGHGNLSVADCRCAHVRKGLDGHIGADDRGLHVAHLSPGDSYQNPLRALPDCGHDHFHGGRGSLHDPGEFCPAAHGDFPYNILEIGFFLEILCFSMGLGYKMWQTNKDRQRIQEAYIRELKRNEAIIQEANLQLEQKVKERTSEVIRKNKEIEDERKKQMAGDYERRLAIAEMSALRAQMNPHFMFNSMNTLEAF